ncbi:hypothetical protein MHYP_G00022330 [Metynnis hypsauchen]
MFYSLFLTYIFELMYIGASLLFQSPSVTVDVATLPARRWPQDLHPPQQRLQGHHPRSSARHAVPAEYSPDTTDKVKVNEDHRMILEQVKEYQCLIPLAVFGGVSLLLFILTIIAMCVWQRRGITQQRNSNASGKHQQSSSETQYATLKFGPERQ